MDWIVVIEWIIVIHLNRLVLNINDRLKAASDEKHRKVVHLFTIPFVVRNCFSILCRQLAVNYFCILLSYYTITTLIIALEVAYLKSP